MKAILSLLRPRLLSLKPGRGTQATNGRRFFKVALMAVIGLLFWAVLFAVTLRVLTYFKGIEELGTLLAFKLLAMLLITFFALLLFSAILTSLSKLYMSRDLFLVHAMPVAAYKVFVARWLEITGDSSWMVVTYTLPVFLAYGIVFSAGPAFYLTGTCVLLLLVVIASSLGALLVMLVVSWIPAHRIRSLILLLGLLAFVILFLSFRLLRPERMVDPEAFASVLLYLNTLQTPASPLIPSTWAFDAIAATLGSLQVTAVSPWLHLGLLGLFAALMFGVNMVIADRYYFHSFSKSQTAPQRLLRGSTAQQRILLRYLPVGSRTLITKEILSFFRDQTQWSQLILIGALVVIYVFNFKALPLERVPIRTFYLQNLLSFLNVGLAAFVLSAVTARFAYPAVSNENEAIWIVRAAPVSIRRFLWTKFWIYLVPLLMLTEVLVAATNILLQVTPFMMILSVVTIFCLVPGVVSLGIGLGAAYPNFKAENPAQAVTGFGGLVFMILCAAFIAAVLMLEAGPVYAIFSTDVRGLSLSLAVRIWIVASFGAAFLLAITVVILPMRFGIRRLGAILS